MSQKNAAVSTVQRVCMSNLLNYLKIKEKYSIGKKE